MEYDDDKNKAKKIRNLGIHQVIPTFCLIVEMRE